MYDPWFVLFGVLIISGVVITSLALLIWVRRENSHHKEMRAGEYASLITALTRMYILSDDEDQGGEARRSLAESVSRVNLFAGTGVLVHLNALLDLQNRSHSGARDIPKEHAILQQLVLAIRDETGAPDQKRIRDKKISFKFYLPSHQKKKDPGSGKEQIPRVL